jgi:hypothetical protein
MDVDIARYSDRCDSPTISFPIESLEHWKTKVQVSLVTGGSTKVLMDGASLLLDTGFAVPAGTPEFVNAFGVPSVDGYIPCPSQDSRLVLTSSTGESLAIDAIIFVKPKGNQCQSVVKDISSISMALPFDIALGVNMLMRLYLVFDKSAKAVHACLGKGHEGITTFAGGINQVPIRPVSI